MTEPAPAAEGPATELTAAKFGTFSGVFRPIFLTILGAMLYLREGWLVGNAGILGALFVIGAAYTITGTTALSLSSIATNLRVRAGGAFAIISAALGLEAGGAIGVPLYIAQTISSVMYLFAFSEAWAYLFPSHAPMLVVFGAYLVSGALVLKSARLAVAAQGAMFLVVLAAVASGLGGWFGGDHVRPVVVGAFSDASLLTCFAVFFPAATGIMVGVGMSGSLENPRKSIPYGTMMAWGATLIIYVVGAIWYATMATPEELLGGGLLLVDHALFGPLVLFGLLSSTLMASLSSLVAAPQLLQAMAEYKVVPFSDWLAAKTEAGEARNATLATLGLAALGLSAGSLDAIAPVITSFFVMTYLAVNVVVLLEQALGQVSWRPVFAVPTVVPMIGATACVVGLVLSSPAGGLPEVLFVVGIYAYLSRRGHVDTPWETVQSGMAQAIATWGAMKAAQLGKSERSWKPDILAPVSSVEEAEAMAAVAETLVQFRGSVKFIATTDDEALYTALRKIIHGMRERGRFCSWHEMPQEAPGQGAIVSLNAMKGTFFSPNLLLLGAHYNDEAMINLVANHARSVGVGVVLAFDDKQAPMRPCSQVNVWLSDRSPSWELSLHIANLDLPVLLGYLTTRVKEGDVRLATVLRDENNKPDAERFLADLIELGRLPQTSAHVLTGSLLERLENGPSANLHVFGLPPQISLERLETIHQAAGVPCLFVQDSGQESAIA